MDAGGDTKTVKYINCVYDECYDVKCIELGRLGHVMKVEGK
jgi:hypothetical protein